MTQQGMARTLVLTLVFWATCAAASAALAQAPAGTTPARLAPDPGAAAAVADTLGGSITEPEILTLGDALALALRHSPALSRWPWELRALDAD